MIADLNTCVLPNSNTFDGDKIVCLFRNIGETQLYVADKGRYVKITLTGKDALKNFSDNSNELCMHVRLVGGQTVGSSPGVSALTAQRFIPVTKKAKWPEFVEKPPPLVPVRDAPPPLRGGQMRLEDSRVRRSDSRIAENPSVSVIPQSDEVVEIPGPRLKKLVSRPLSHISAKYTFLFSVHARVCYVSEPAHIEIFGRDPFDVVNILLNGGNNALTRLSVFGMDLARKAKSGLVLERVYEFTSLKIEKSNSKSTRIPGIGWNLSADSSTTWKELDLSIPRACSIIETFVPFPVLNDYSLTHCCDMYGILLSITPPLLTKRNKIFRKAAVAISADHAVLVMIWDGLVVTEIEGMKTGNFIGIKNVVFTEQRNRETHFTLQVTDASFRVKTVVGEAFEKFAVVHADQIRKRYQFFAAQLTSMGMSMTLDCFVDDVMLNLQRDSGYRSFRILGLITSIDGASGNQLHYMGCGEPGCTPKKIVVDPETKVGTCPKCGKVNGRTKPVPFARITVLDFIGAVNIHVLFREELFEKLFKCEFADYCRMIEGGVDGEEQKTAMIDRTMWSEVMVTFKHSPPADSFPEKLLLTDVAYPSPEEVLAFIKPLGDEMEMDVIRHLPIESQLFSQE
jgi:hypothetical protein